MPFVLLPAVDVADGRAVRPSGVPTAGEVVDADPLVTALAWQADGADWIHLVDLDAAFGRGSNADLLAAVIGELDVDVELSGGICDDTSLTRALSTNCARVVISTAALDDVEWCSRVVAEHGDRVAVALDVRVVPTLDGGLQYRLAARGSTREGGDGFETIERLDRNGCARYLVTDVGRDGMLRGPNVELYRTVTNATTTPVIASGGIATIHDLQTLAEVAANRANLEGAIIGTALYAGHFTLPEALAVVATA